MRGEGRYTEAVVRIYVEGRKGRGRGGGSLIHTETAALLHVDREGADNIHMGVVTVTNAKTMGMGGQLLFYPRRNNPADRP